YFDYVMFSWGNCQAGDRLVMERKLGRFPDQQDLSEGFQPGVRFYFRYDELIKHPGAVFDGVLPLKIKDGVVLDDWLYKIVIPAPFRKDISIPKNLNDKVVFVEYDCKDIWEWSEKVYNIIK
ncbi:MAG: phosphate ABC transporter ATPase, partial [Clostridia bacterium]|nr:phosphate ABC transporter ATPase [Clostridia bacterium]